MHSLSLLLLATLATLSSSSSSYSTATAQSWVDVDVHVPTFTSPDLDVSSDGVAFSSGGVQFGDHTTTTRVATVATTRDDLFDSDPRFSARGSVIPTAQLFQCSRETHIPFVSTEGCHRIRSRDQCLQTAIRYHGHDVKCEWDSGVCHPGCSCGYGKTHVGDGGPVRGRFICKKRSLRAGHCSEIKYRDVCLQSKVSYGGHQVLCEWDSGTCHEGCGCGY